MDADEPEDMVFLRAVYERLEATVASHGEMSGVIGSRTRFD
jgi:hypothetical protein